MPDLVVNVVGRRERRDVVVPADAPVALVAANLAEECGEQPANGGLPLPWELRLDDDRTLPGNRSLSQCGVADGATLRLHQRRATLPAPEPTARPESAWDRTRHVLPRRLSRGERLLAMARAVMSPDGLDDAPPMHVSEPGSPPSPSLLTVPQRSPLSKRVRATWRRTNNHYRLEELIAQPSLGRCATIAVVSPKGGVGKTTITALLGMLLANVRRDRIVAIDTNPDYGSLGRTLTPDHHIHVDDLLRVLDHPSLTVTRLDASLGRAPHGLMVLPAPTDPERMERLDEAAYTRVIRRMQELVGVVLLDCGTGLQDPAARAAMSTADQLVLITDAEPATASLVAEASELLRRVGPPLMLVINKMPERGSRLDVDMLAGFVPDASGLITVPAEAGAASRLAAGDFDWADAPETWQLSVRRLAAALVAEWPRIGLTH